MPLLVNYRQDRTRKVFILSPSITVVTGFVILLKGSDGKGLGEIRQSKVTLFHVVWMMVLGDSFFPCSVPWGGRESGGRIQLSKVSRLLRSTSPAGPAAIGRRGTQNNSARRTKFFQPALQSITMLHLIYVVITPILVWMGSVTSLFRNAKCLLMTRSAIDVVESQEDLPNLTVCLSCCRV